MPVVLVTLAGSISRLCDLIPVNFATPSLPPWSTQKSCHDIQPKSTIYGGRLGIQNLSSTSHIHFNTFCHRVVETALNIPMASAFELDGPVFHTAPTHELPIRASSLLEEETGADRRAHDHNLHTHSPISTSRLFDDSSALSIATEISHDQSFSYGMEKGFWRVRQGAQELLRFAELYSQHRASQMTPADDSFVLHALPKQIDLVSMTQLSWGLLNAVGDINVHSRKATETLEWMHEDDKPSNAKRRKRSRRRDSDISMTACKKCGVMDSPRWRAGPAGPSTLCNVCGLLYAKRSRRHGSGSESQSAAR
ncbi:hypothetical protein QC762_118400 [Podospora pseudocomata]|uniref:GATA-type domain-containing protein n=1 Tax=Podospora pseudocomata TaxID=2093779 RepID=A0ABR0GX95_9PEZI|nr:hypothetical protein QC762_118400 [Podospora pseudocomata]